MKVSNVIRMIKSIHSNAKINRERVGQSVVYAVARVCDGRIRYDIRGELDGSVTIELTVDGRVSTTRSITRPDEFYDLVDVNVYRAMRRIENG